MIEWIVRTVPERSEFLKNTLRSVPHVKVIVDEKHRGVTYATLEAVKMGEKLFSHRCCYVGILADDFVYCDNFTDRMENLLKHCPRFEAYILFSMAKPAGKIVWEGFGFQLRRKRKNQLCGIAIYSFRALSLVKNVLEERYKMGARRDYDGVVANAFWKEKLSAAVVWPNPVDHIGKKSVIGNSWQAFGRERKSAWSIANQNEC